MKIFDSLKRRYIEVSVSENCYVNELGEELVRLEKWGKSGKVIHKNYSYIVNGKEMPVYGAGGSCGHGWGGQVVGYAISSELE